MTHDPLCPWYPNTHEDVSCRDAETLVTFCEVIAMVREDARGNNFTPDDFANAMTESYQRGLAFNTKAADLAAIDALRKEPDD